MRGRKERKKEAVCCLAKKRSFPFFLYHGKFIVREGHKWVSERGSTMHQGGNEGRVHFGKGICCMLHIPAVAFTYVELELLDRV